MPSYLYKVGYTAQAWANQLKSPKDRMKAIAPVIQAHGGKVVCAYYTFGEDDLILIADMPNNVSAAAFSLAAGAGGATTHVSTTPLMSMADGVKAMQAAQKSTYKPPK